MSAGVLISLNQNFSWSNFLPSWTRVTFDLRETAYEISIDRECEHQRNNWKRHGRFFTDGINIVANYVFIRPRCNLYTLGRIGYRYERSARLFEKGGLAQSSTGTLKVERIRLPVVPCRTCRERWSSEEVRAACPFHHAFIAATFAVRDKMLSAIESLIAVCS